jgi:gamma-glutamyl:cysteine ligase YbdK (ATP-grasp superfamily)
MPETHGSAVELATGVHRDIPGAARELGELRAQLSEALEAAIRALNRLRAHLPLLLALSANSPFWQGRDTGLASARAGRSGCRD